VKKELELVSTWRDKAIEESLSMYDAIVQGLDARFRAAGREAKGPAYLDTRRRRRAR